VRSEIATLEELREQAVSILNERGYKVKEVETVTTGQELIDGLQVVVNAHFYNFDLKAQLDTIIDAVRQLG
jgi:hypothetical protein